MALPLAKYISDGGCSNAAPADNPSPPSPVMMDMRTRVLIPLVMAVVGFCAPAPADARQDTAGTSQAQEAERRVVERRIEDASQTREDLRRILRVYPEAVGEILRRDPSLITRADYMAPYPELVKFLAAHPEIQRNVEYYFEGYGGWRRQPEDLEYEALGVLLGGLAGFFIMAGIIGVFAWLVRAVIQHRRWLKASQVQAEVHTKLMDRLTTSEELLAYIQSPAGRRFLEAAPARTEADSPGFPAPVGPIIWSVMAGIVLATVGAGFRIAAGRIGNEAQNAFVVVGVILLALGAGFALAAVAAYIVSSRLGLFQTRATQPADSANA